MAGQRVTTIKPVDESKDAGAHAADLNFPEAGGTSR